MEKESALQKPPAKPLSRAERQRMLLRADIIQAAFEEFSAQGYHQTGIADIAKRLGIGHGTFYRYFKNKRDIFEHVIDDVTARIAAVLVEDNAPTAVNNIDDYRSQTQRIGSRLTKIMVETPGMLRMVLFEATSIDQEMTEKIMAFFDWAANQVTAYMENGVTLGFFRKDLDIEATGHVIVGMIITTALNFLHSTDDKEMQKRISAAVLDILIDGIADSGTSATLN